MRCHVSPRGWDHSERLPLADSWPGRLCPPAERAAAWSPEPSVAPQRLGSGPRPLAWCSGRSPPFLPGFRVSQSPATLGLCPSAGSAGFLPSFPLPVRTPSIPSSNVSLGATFPPSQGLVFPSSVSLSVLPTSHLWNLTQLPLHEAPPPRDPWLTSAGGGAVTGKGTQAGAGNGAHSGRGRGTSCDQTPLTARSGGRQPRSWESPNHGREVAHVGRLAAPSPRGPKRPLGRAGGCSQLTPVQPPPAAFRLGPPGQTPWGDSASPKGPVLGGGVPPPAPPQQLPPYSPG